MTSSAGSVLPGPALPVPRGPLSAAVIDGLAGQRWDAPWPVAEADPFGDDVQLALYVAYELHYRGFAGVPDALEWAPELLVRRADLEQAFLGELRALASGAGCGSDVEGAVAALLAATGEGGASAHLAAAGERWQLREVAAHRSLYHLKEADPQAWVIPRLSGRAKAGVVAVEFDEYGAGSAARMHSALFADLMRDLGLDPAYGRYLDDVGAPMLAIVNFMSLCGLHRALRGALIGQLAAVEITSPPGSKRMITALERLGCGAAARRFYAEHVVADSVHEQVMRRDVIGGLLADEPALAADVVFGIVASGLLDDRLDAHLLGSWAAGASSLRSPLPDLVASG